MFGFRRERMPVFNQHLAFLEQGAIFDGNHVKGLVIIVLSIDSENLQAFFDGEIRAAYQHGIREQRVIGILAAVAECP